MRIASALAKTSAGMSILIIVLIVGTSLGPFAHANETVTPLEHIFVIMQENHSFDNYFGTYPTANKTLSTDLTSQLQNVSGFPEGICLSMDGACVSPYLANGTSTPNPVEGQLTYEADFNGGRMDGFGRYSGIQSLAYFDYHQIAAYWDYAEEYGIANAYFASTITTTTPNRLMLLAGDSPVSHNYGPPPFIPYNDTVLGQLAAHGVTWGYYDFLSAYGTVRNVYPLNFTAGMGSDDLNKIQDISTLLRDLSQNDGLPSVNFVMALGSGGLDEHPSENVTAGEMWTVSIINAIMRSSYWPSSAIFLTWDEGGGYYDHVPPPQVLKINHGFGHELDGYGQRVPFLVISPYAKENYVSTTVLNHMSIDKFIEYNWRITPLTQNIADSNNLLDFFYFSGTPRSPIVLEPNGPNSYASYPIPIQIPLTDLPYTRIGPANETGSGSNATPFYTTPFVLTAIFVTGIAILLLVTFRKSWGRHRQTSFATSA